MQRLSLGLTVADVRERKIGHVTALLSCCFEVTTDETKLNLTPPSIFNVTTQMAILICNAEHVGNYQCLVHKSEVDS